MKLLHYTSYRYFLFAALLTLVSISIFYISLNKVFVDSIDSDLCQQSSEIPSFLNTIKSPKDLELQKAFNNDLNIIAADSCSFSPEPFNRVMDKYKLLF